MGEFLDDSELEYFTHRYSRGNRDTEAEADCCSRGLADQGREGAGGGERRKRAGRTELEVRRAAGAWQADAAQRRGDPPRAIASGRVGTRRVAGVGVRRSGREAVALLVLLPRAAGAGGVAG